MGTGGLAFPGDGPRGKEDGGQAPGQVGPGWAGQISLCRQPEWWGPATACAPSLPGRL